MILDYVEGMLKQVCDACGTEREIPAPDTLPKDPENAFITAIPLPPCDVCGSVEYMNPDVPTAPEDMNIAEKIPPKEWRQRTIIRAVVCALKSEKPVPPKVPPIPRGVRKQPRHAEEA